MLRRAADRAAFRWIAGTVAILAVVAAIVVGWSAWRAAGRRWRDGRLAEAREAAEAGRFATARSILDELAGRRPGDGEVLLELGLCELALGRVEEAAAVLDRVPAGSPAAAAAAVRRGRLLLDEGRLSAVEALIDPAMVEGAGPVAAEALRLLETAYRVEGRLDEARALYRRAFGGAADPATAIREASGINYRVVVGAARTLLDRGLEAAPDDDRVWLGLAALETAIGRLDEADGWLDRCEQSRPGDPSVAKARLRWARAADDPAAARDALHRLPAEALAPGDSLELLAWFARHRGDARGEREALAAALEVAGTDRSEALGRLAVLAAEAGDDEAASRYRGEKEAYERDLRRYAELLFGRDPVGDAEELAGLAGGLDRPWEARAWALLADPSAGPSAPDPDLAWAGPPGGPAPDDLRAALLAAARVAAGIDDGDGTPRALPSFRDRAAESGLVFAYDPGRLGPGRSVAEMMGGGVALIDVDGDGWLDVYLPQGGAFPPPEGAPNGDRFFRNRGDGGFEDATAAAGLDGIPGGYGLGAAVGDVDGDGRPDLLISRWRGLRLLRNRGDGGFEDATAAAGLDGPLDFPTSAAFADLDGDGDLDLYVCRYLAVDPSRPPVRPAPGDVSYANPLLYEALPDRLYRNDGGRFVDVSEASGIAAVTAARGLGVVAGDLDDDGLIDLFVANDMTANFLFRNRGGLEFEEVGERAGIAAGGEGIYQASMGVALGDLDGDERPDLAVTNYLGEGMAFYRNLGRGLFAEQSAAVGLLTTTRYVLGFGTAFLDADLDGRLDLAAANGHVFDDRPRLPFAMPAQLLLGTADGRLEDVTEALGPPWTTPRVGRGLAVGDLDNDGRADLLIVAQDGPLAYLHNEDGTAGRSLTIALEATATAPSAEGARVAVTGGGRRRVLWKAGGGSYLSASDPRLHVGLGGADRAEAVEVRWPSGRVDRHADLPAGTAWLLREGDPTPRPSPASGR